MDELARALRVFRTRCNFCCSASLCELSSSPSSLDAFRLSLEVSEGGVRFRSFSGLALTLQEINQNLKTEVHSEYEIQSEFEIPIRI